MTEEQKIMQKLRNARREIIKAVERTAEVDLRPGHLAEAKRRIEAVRDEANRAVAIFEKARSEMTAELYALVPSSHNKNQKAHIAWVEPCDPDPPKWTVPEDERRYLCGRKAKGLHVRTFRWKSSDTFPTCSRCRKVAESLESL